MAHNARAKKEREAKSALGPFGSRGQGVSVLNFVWVSFVVSLHEFMRALEDSSRMLDDDGIGLAMCLGMSSKQSPKNNR